ncbi:sensor histidine kinase [Peterkaempfera sp. SMS 1(5)a]|uniref:sensor histidine kinase n=1 Tax=Peterkaempfera podocarpi TaxID=3232308 RepID=UPI0036725A0D
MTPEAQDTEDALTPPMDLVLQAQHGERRRIARELHDRTAHALGVALQSLKLYRLYARTDPQRAERRLAVAEQSVHEALATVLGIATELRISVEGSGLRAALDDYLMRAAPRDVKVELTCGMLGGIPGPTADQLYLMVREAVRNALLHAGPRRVWIDLRVVDGVLQARVSDDGAGFDTEQVTAHQGAGLLSMSERAELIGAELEMQSSSAGTLVQIRVPLPHPEES